MNNRVVHRWSLIAVLIGLAWRMGAAEAPATNSAPMPRPRLTETLRAKAEGIAQESPSGGVLAMNRVVVKESRMPSGPPKEVENQGRFSIFDGGYLLTNRGEKFSTQVGLWRHVDIMEEPTVELRQSMRVRMGLLKFSW